METTGATRTDRGRPEGESPAGAGTGARRGGWRRDRGAPSWNQNGAEAIRSTPARTRTRENVCWWPELGYCKRFKRLFY